MGTVDDSTRERECPPESQLADFLSGRITAGETFEIIAAHLETCPTCAAAAITSTGNQPDHFESVLAAAKIKRTDDSIRLAPGYELVEEIGRGGTGIVYLAQQHGLKRKVALKMLIGGVHSSPSQLARLRRESESLAKLDHPNIVRIIESGEQDGTPFIAMEWVDGPTLDRALSKQLAEPRDAARLVAKLADAIQSAHDNGITHLDLKPQNVILASQLSGYSDSKERETGSLFAYPKLLDFGLTGFRSDEFQTATGELLGTPAYMAPEIALGQRNGNEPAADIYGLGTILYQCLTGRPPATGSNTAQILAAVIETDIVDVGVLRKGIPADLKVICHRCLEKSPADRFATAADLRDDLQRYLDNEPIHSKPTPVLKKCYKWCRRHPWTTTICTLVGIFIIVGIAGWIYHQSRLNDESQKTARQRDHALEKYRETRQALLGILDVAVRQSNSSAPGVQSVTNQQLMESLRLFEELAQDDDSPQAKIDLAEIYMRTASALIAQGENQRALEMLSKVDNSLNSLDQNQQRKILQMLFGSKIKQAAAISSMGDPQAALDLLTAIKPLAQRLYNIPDASLADMESLAWYYHNTANTYTYLNNREDASSNYKKAIEIRRSALAQRPGNLDFMIRLAQSEVSLGAALMGLGNNEDALESYRSGIETLENVLRKKPKDVEILNSIATANLNRSNIFAGQSELERAIDVCTDSIDDLLSVLKTDPDHWTTRHNLSMLFANRAVFIGSVEGGDDNLPDWREAVRHAVDPNTRNQCVLYLIDTLLNRHDYNAMLDTIQSELAGDQVEPFFRYRLIKRAASMLDAKDDAEPIDGQLATKVSNMIASEIQQLAKENFFNAKPRYKDEILTSDKFESFRKLNDATKLNAVFTSK